MNKNTLWTRLKSACLLVGVILLGGCQYLHAASKTNITCGQSGYGEWYDYYWSGLACMDISNWPKAESELRLALEKRDKDKRRAYTKGMHWITDYFPNRELGITLFYLKQHTEAADKLKLSLNQFPSTKAELYLNKTRRNLPALRSTDSALPVIKGLLAQNNMLILTLNDDTFIEHIWINNQRWTWQDVFAADDALVSIQRAKSEIKLFYQFDPKTHKGIVVKAQDVFGKTNIEDFSYLLDSLPPKISRLTITKVRPGRWDVTGQVTDQSGIKRLTINGTVKEANNNKRIAIKQRIKGNEMLLTAIDRNGNRVEKTVNLSEEQTLKLNLLNPIPAFTQQGRVLVQGQIVSGIDIDSLLINHKPVALHGNNTFMADVLLNSGQTPIIIEIANANETINWQHIITRSKADDLPFEERLRVAMFPFVCDIAKGDLCQGEDRVDLKLRSDITERERFYMVEQANLAPNKKKQQQCAAGIGKLEQCTKRELTLRQPNTILVGQMGKRTRQTPGGSQIIGDEAYTRMIDPATGQLLIAFDAYVEDGETMPLIEQQLFNKIHEKFPITTSKPLKVIDGDIEAEFDYKQMLWPNMPMKLFNGKEACGVGKVERVEADSVVVVLAGRCRSGGDGVKTLVTL